MRWTRVIISNTEEKILLFWGLGHRGYSCDQIHVKNVPDQAFVLEQWSFKVARGGGIHPPSNVGLKYIIQHADIYILIFYDSYFIDLINILNIC